MLETQYGCVLYCFHVRGLAPCPTTSTSSPTATAPPAILFRQAQRDGKRIRRTTLANLSKLPPQIVDGIRAMLRGGQIYRPGEEAFCIRRSLPHGHVAAVIGVWRQLGLERLLQRTRSRRRDLALAAIVARVLQPGSKLATARGLSPQSATSSLGALLGLGPVRGNEMLDMLDWLLGRPAWIEKSLARRHLEGATLLLYDVSSSYLEGRCCPLAAFGHNRDGKQGKQQIVFGLLCAADGIAEIRSPDFPGERLLVCLNPRLRHERGQEAINRRVGRDVSRKKVDKHFAIEVTDDEIRWSRKQDKINAEAQLDGIYVIRTSLQSSALGAPEAVEAYKSLAHVERAFRSLKTAQLAVRPIFVYSEDHVRGHILLCMLAYYVEWHLRRRLAPLLFEEEDRAGARALRQSPVEKAQVSASTKAKAASKQTPEGLPVHSFQTLLADLGTLTLNQVTLPDAPQHPFPMVAKPTPLQAKAFDLLGVDPGKLVASKLAG